MAEAALVPWPLVVLLVAAPIAWAQARATRGRGARWTGATLAAAAAAAFLLAALDATQPARRLPSALGGAPLEVGGAASLLTMVSAGALAAVALYATRGMREEVGLERLFPLLALTAAGAAGIGMAADLFQLFVFFELMAVSGAGLVAYRLWSFEAIEGAVKYLVQGAVGSMTALLGIALLYLSVGSLDPLVIRAQAASLPPTVALCAAALITIGYGVKAGLVPLHTWLPDAHAAAPAAGAAVLSGIIVPFGVVTLAKTLAAFGAPLADPAGGAGLLVLVLAAVTMTAGNLLAFRQTDIRRMLACSSVAQSGLALLAFGLALTYGAPSAVEAALFVVATTALLKVGAFLAAGALAMEAGSPRIDRLAGTGRRAPLAGAALAVLLLSLAGLPPTGGFIAKLFVAKAALEVPGALPLLLVVVLALNSVLSLGYYVPVAMRLFQSSEGAEPRHTAPRSSQAVAGAAAALAVLLGLFPEPLVAVARVAGAGLLGGA